MHVTGAWSAAEAGEFLETTRVPVRLACHTPKGHLWMLSLWYLWTGSDASDEVAEVSDAPDEAADGNDASDEVAEVGAAPTDLAGCRSEGPELCCATSANADVVEYLRSDDAVAFEISTNHPPYRGVRGRGTATVEPDEEKALLTHLLDRYLGGTDNDLAGRLLAPEREEVRIRITPERLHSWDFSERMRDVSTATREE
ncbi:pyridoxamine 5'-phosphate oxidase family protein [Halobellus sp. H-GB7]|uniref:pyridoxamine 5'-phosphate oxidase family protein n=1 Tax=Halobellus sp. H-GB7 TaxID=3069756 RepID=UPI0027B27F70|nr:pyridoxamine 5'-phosphate oxidase family protein [Halobellus sp. H-GB7]MDQ2056063.1 pyridoxamine 5'-phosphate oxidase family protein [Halobellus sp. H-GB7]